MYSGALRVLSINTNTGQMAALRILNATGASAQQIEQQIATGLKVASAKDDGSAYAIAQNARALSASYDALSQVQDRAQGLLERHAIQPAKHLGSLDPDETIGALGDRHFSYDPIAGRHRRTIPSAEKPDR